MKQSLTHLELSFYGRQEAWWEHAKKEVEGQKEKGGGGNKIFSAWRFVLKKWGPEVLSWRLI